jgi:hypothetical protein
LRYFRPEGHRIHTREAFVVKVRIVAAAVLAVGVALGTAGCNLIQPQATRLAYDASDGVSLNVGELQLRNLMIISDNGETGNLLVGIANSTGVDADLHISFISGGELVEGHLEVPSNDKTVTSWGSGSEDRIILGGINTMPGGLLEVAFEADGDTKTVLVPVLTSAQPEYEGLEPQKVTKISK